MDVRTIEILGLPVACAIYDSALARLKELTREPRATTVCPSNTSILAEARHNPDFVRVMGGFDPILPDVGGYLSLDFTSPTSEANRRAELLGGVMEPKRFS